MSSHSIFALPTSTTLNIPRPQSQKAGKRKRNTQYGHQDFARQSDDSTTSDPIHVQSTEYTAVVTPAERSQRRLAGLPLDQLPPPYPFPHAPLPSKSPTTEIGAHEQGVSSQVPKFQAKPYLRSQHLSAMMAVLHRSMINQDYTRAGRALGLILRSELAGRPIDIRSTGLWGIGAEILLHEKSARNRMEDNHTSQNTITRGGFEHAKLYYERLMVQYPPNRTWPDVVNTLDFCIAMFSLWIYVTNLEAEQLHDRATSQDEDDADDSDLILYEAKQWELNQAKQIGEAMDHRMQDITFAGFEEMMRLRAMVALWVADLLEACIELEQEANNAQYTFEQDPLSTNVERMRVDTPQQVVLPQVRMNEASEHRKRARTLFNKLNQTNAAEDAS